MEQSDLDYALSLHYLLNGESITDVIAQTGGEQSSVKQESDDDSFEEGIYEKIQVSGFKNC